MVTDGVPDIGRLAQLGVARISWGPIPYINTIAALQHDAKSVLS
jgi:2-methylisocitrate lyase-like PEP mutase family enzyme